MNLGNPAKRPHYYQSCTALERPRLSVWVLDSSPIIILYLPMDQRLSAAICSCPSQAAKLRRTPRLYTSVLIPLFRKRYRVQWRLSIPPLAKTPKPGKLVHEHHPAGDDGPYQPRDNRKTISDRDEERAGEYQRAEYDVRGDEKRYEARETSVDECFVPDYELCLFLYFPWRDPGLEPSAWLSDVWILDLDTEVKRKCRKHMRYSTQEEPQKNEGGQFRCKNHDDSGSELISQLRHVDNRPNRNEVLSNPDQCLTAKRQGWDIKPAWSSLLQFAELAVLKQRARRYTGRSGAEEKA